MNRTITLLAAVALAAAAPATGADAQLTAADREQLVELLEDGRDRLLTAVAALDDAGWNYKSSPERWSPAEIVEHLYKSEGLFGGTLEQTLAGKADPEWKSKTGGRTATLRSMMLNRTQRAQAPEPIKPVGEMTRLELIQGFAEARAKIIEFTTTTNKAIKEHVTEFGPFSAVNGMQLVVLRGAHTLRHFAQLEEVLADPGFPK